MTRTHSSRHFRRHLLHTCTVQPPSEGAADEFGHPTIAWNADDYITGVSCRFIHRVHTTVPGREVDRPTSGVLIYNLTMFFDYTDVTKNITEKYLISNIRKKSDGSLIEAGPLNIMLVRNAGGTDHHLEVHLEWGDAAPVY